MHPSTRFFFLRVLCAGLLLLSATGCDLLSPDDEEDLLFKNVAVSETGNSRIPWVAVHTNGDVLGAVRTGGQVTGAVFRDRNGNPFSVELGSDGMPTRAVAPGGYVLVFENWGSGKVDVALIAPNGNITLHEGVSAPMPSPAMQAPAVTASSSNALTMVEGLRAAAIGLSVAGCVTAVILSAGVALPCGAAVVGIIAATIPTDDPALEASSGGIALAAAGIGCGSMEPFSCATLVAEIAAMIAEAHEDTVDHHASDIAGATGGLRFGGVWERDDISHAWFIIGLDEVRDAFLQGSCYWFTRGEFVKVEGDVFTYSNSSGSVDLRYDRLSSTRLRVTRINDGFSATLTKTSRSPSSFTPECLSLGRAPPAPVLAPRALSQLPR